MDRTGDKTEVVGVRGGGGGLATAGADAAGATCTFKSAAGFGTIIGIGRALSCASASQNALCVIKLSLLLIQ